MHGFRWSWRIFPRNSRRFGFRSGGGYGSRLRGEALLRVSPLPAFHPVAKFARLWCGLCLKGERGWGCFSRDFGGLYNLDAMPAAYGRSRRAGWDPAGSDY